MKRLLAFVAVFLLFTGCQTFKVMPSHPTVDLGFQRQDSTCNATLTVFGQTLQQKVPQFFCELPMLSQLRLRYYLNFSSDSVRTDSIEIVSPATRTNGAQTGGK